MICSIAVTSEMFGMLCSVTGCSVNTAAAMSGNAAFLLPLAVTTPESGTPPSMTSSSIALTQGLPEILDEVVGMLEADAEPQEIVGRARGRALHGRAMLEQALRRAERRGAREDPHLAGHGERRVAPAAHLHREHAAEARHLAVRHRVLRVARQPRDAPAHQPAVERRRHRAAGGLDRAKAIEVGVVAIAAAHHRAAHDVAVAAEVLRR